MLDKRMQDAFNSQINWEFYSAYLYLSMASHFAETGMAGGQNWMTVQYQEEIAHARIMFSYVLTRGGRVILEAIEQPETEWPTGLAVFEDALAHEEKVTARIHDMASLALELKDHARTTSSSGSSPNRSRRKRAPWTWSTSSSWPASTPAGLYQLDKELAVRAYNVPFRRWRRWTRRPAPDARPAERRPRRGAHRDAGQSGLTSSRQGFSGPQTCGQLLQRAESLRSRKRLASRRTPGRGRSARASSRAAG